MWWVSCSSQLKSCLLYSEEIFLFADKILQNYYHAMPYAPVIVKQTPKQHLFTPYPHPHLEVFIAGFSLKARLRWRETKVRDSFVYKLMAAVCCRPVRASDERWSTLMLRNENFSYAWSAVGSGTPAYFHRAYDDETVTTSWFVDD